MAAIGREVWLIDASTGAARAAADIARELSTQRREKVPLKHLLFGLNCGTSNAASDLSSNVVLGNCSDLTIAAGGRSILAEVAKCEIFMDETSFAIHRIGISI